MPLSETLKAFLNLNGTLIILILFENIFIYIFNYRHFKFYI